MRFFVGLCLAVFFISPSLQAQYADEYNGGFKFEFDEDGDKYLRMMAYGHFWWQDNEGHNSNDGFAIRRMGVLMYAEINQRFKLVSHFGLSTLNANNIYPTEDGGGPNIQLVDLYGEFTAVPEKLYIGIGKHYVNGISRLNSLSTLNILTVDVNRSSWSTVGLSDQGVRHLGVFARGSFGKFQYRLAINAPQVNTVDGDKDTTILPGEEKYLGSALLEKGKYAYAGYFDYQFLDKESDFLPFRVGTYLGTKEVFNIGAGFFYHPEGIAHQTENTLTAKDVWHVAGDVFYDSPLGENGGALTTYASYQYSKMGENYLNGRINGNGSQFYVQGGYLIPKSTDTHIFRNRFQPYLAYSYRDFKGLNKAAEEFQAGINWYVDGQNAKITAQYQNSPDLPKGKQHQVIVQVMILL
ncbi:MAG TPA: hypothetical protein VK021_05020 [Flavobacteriaceae bacterium]|nr:hypothetical protein [Flavobacteriaceae bacterium]